MDLDPVEAVEVATNKPALAQQHIKTALPAHYPNFNLCKQYISTLQKRLKSGILI